MKLPFSIRAIGSPPALDPRPVAPIEKLVKKHYPGVELVKTLAG